MAARGYTFLKHRETHRIVASVNSAEHGDLCRKCGFRRVLRGRCIVCEEQKRVWRETLLDDTPESRAAIDSILKEKNGEEFLVGCFEVSPRCKPEDV